MIKGMSGATGSSKAEATATSKQRFPRDWLQALGLNAEIRANLGSSWVIGLATCGMNLVLLGADSNGGITAGIREKLRVKQLLAN